MKAVGLTHYLPVTDSNCLQDLSLPMPSATGMDLLVKVEAVSVNPVDTKVRAAKDGEENPPRVLGWDVAGTVMTCGELVRDFQVGDAIWYAGDLTRPGGNSEYHVVDSRLVSRKPARLGFAEAAAMPLTSITAWEALFERLAISADGADAGKSLLVIGGAGGVGSIAIQLAKKLARLNVIATASRPESTAWCRQQGADLVVSHKGDLVRQLRGLARFDVDFILCCNDTDGHWEAMAELVRPQGRICTIVENRGPLEMTQLKRKSVTFSWEFMFTRSMFQTPDMAAQGELLAQVARLLDDGVLTHTCQQLLAPINAENLRRAHGIVERGGMVGKLVLSGW